MDPAADLRQPWQLGPRGRRGFDRALVAALLLPVVAFPLTGVRWEWTVLGLLQILPLWVRRDHPLLAFTGVAAASALQVPLLDTPLWSQLAYPVALYSLARFGSAVPAALGLLLSLVASVTAALDWTVLTGENPLDARPYALTIGAIVVTAWALGTLGRTRAAYVATLVERAERIRHEAAQQVALAASDERARIAREMHDVVAHGLSVIVVQADGARYAAAHDPTVATEALGTIAGTGREALREMRRMLGLLRADDTGTAPAPGLADVPVLVEQAGEGVRAELDGLDRDVDAGVALTAYRVVQEALSNVRKHAGPQVRTSVAVKVGPGEVVVRVEDDGRGAAAEDDGSGLGLMGMRERVAVPGGTVVAGPRPGGGFRVEARIPT